MLLEWVVPTECPTEHEVVSHVTSLAGETASAQPVRVWAHIVRVNEGEPRRLRLELRLGRESEELRVLESDDCRKLTDAAVLIVALDLQARAESERRTSPSRAPEVPPKPDRPPEERAVSEVPSKTEQGPAGTRAASEPVPPPGGDPPRAPSPTSIRGGLGGEFIADHGTFSTVGWGGSVFGFLGYGPVRVELGGALWPRTRAAATSLRGAGAWINLRALGVRGCWTLPSVPSVAACLHVEAGGLQAAGFGIWRPSTSAGSWVSGLAGFTARPLECGPVRARFMVELGTPLRYPEVVIEGLGEVHTPSSLLFRAGVGLESQLF
jgi:hypothetical protein